MISAQHNQKNKQYQEFSNVEFFSSTIISGKPTRTESVTLEEAEEVEADLDFHQERHKPHALPS
jgi:hypothetical protein